MKKHNTKKKNYIVKKDVIVEKQDMMEKCDVVKKTNNVKKHCSVWLIVAQTNLHVGNESVVNFGVIDKAIQRDVVTGLPCINSSSLKGAIKEFATEKGLDKIKEIFGSTKEDKNNTQKGNALFFDANMLYIPVPSTKENKFYELAFCDEVLKAFVERANTLGASCSVDVLKKEVKEPLENASRSSEKFGEICGNDELPIIARNCLDNGESVNLWYEQVLPSKSILGTIICSEDTEDLDKLLNGKIVQIGANATIGYGYCKFIKL